LAQWLNTTAPNAVNADTNDGVIDWYDQSGYDHHVGQTTAISRPITTTAGINGLPVIRFDANSQEYLEGPNTSEFFGGPDLASNGTVMVVFEQTGNPFGSRQYLHQFVRSSSSGSSFWAMLLDTNGTSYDEQDLSVIIWDEDEGSPAGFDRINATDVFTDNEAFVFGSTFDTDNFYSYLDGTLLGSDVITPTYGNEDGSGSQLIGRPGFATNQFFEGDVAEVIVYSKTLNTAERVLVENYLSAKYDITPIETDVYAGHAISYTVDVAGIGRQSDGTNLEARSAGLVFHDTTGFLDEDGDYTVAGHAGQPGPSEAGGIITDSTNLPSPVNERWARVWYVDRISGLTASGTVTMAFDFSEAGGVGNPATSADNYYLLQDNTPDGPFTIVNVVSKSIGDNGNRVEFAVTCGQLSDGFYYTLGADTEPLAVSLSEFEAAWQKDSVAVDWTTTMEVDTIGFHVWRSTSADGDYVKVSDALVPSADPGANTGGSYHFEDAQAKVGTTYFYKLEEVETGGATNWYGPVSTGEVTPTSVQVVQAAAVGAVTWLPALGLILGLGAFLWIRTRRR
jgi:hypothetical protein